MRKPTGKPDETAKNKIVSTNRKARHDYHIESTMEAGLVLRGTEVKSMRQGRINLRDSYARVEKDGVIIYDMHIAPYDHGNRWNHEPTRPRRLLLRKEQIRKLTGQVKQEGYTLVPLAAYFTPRGHAKLELALARGKKQWDKREDIKKRDADREIAKAIRGENKRGGE